MNGQPAVTECFIVVAEDADGTFGIPAVDHGGTPLPMVGLDPESAELFSRLLDDPRLFMPSRREGSTPKSFKLLRFTGIEVLKEVVPEQPE